MKINETQRLGAVNLYRKEMNPKASDGVAKRGRKDEVQISSEAQQLLEARAAERGEKVRELKQAVSSGTYRVETGVLAEKMYPYFNL